MFCRAIGDANPIFRNRDAAIAAGYEDLMAPLTFVQASAHFDEHYPGRPRPGEPWMGSGATPTGMPALSTGEPSEGTELHAEQHFTYHRHVRAGDVLTVRTSPGDRWQKVSKRAGTLLFQETIHDYLDEAGNPVITAREVGVRTSQSVGDNTGEPRSARPPSVDAASPAEVVDEWETELVDDLTRTRIAMYAGASGDFTPIHTDELYARDVAELPTVMAHGMLTMAMTGVAVTDRFGLLAVAEFGARFLQPVWPGDTLTATMRVEAGAGAEEDSHSKVTITTTNQAGVPVLRATATVGRADSPG